MENALKSTPEAGSVQVAITVEAQELIFTIQNTGEPLAQDLVQWINNFRSEGSLLNSRPAKLGLGLLIVQNILLLHNSTLKTQFQNGINIFTFRIPVYNHSVKLSTGNLSVLFKRFNSVHKRYTSVILFVGNG